MVCAPANTARDAFDIAAGGGVPLERSRRDPTLNQHSPEQLLHGGQHFDDIPRSLRRSAERANDTEELPREVMTALVESEQLKRPLPAAWR